jgi:uncharacterized protein YhbP (UPF0306 family)
MDVEKVVREYIDKTFHMSLATSVDGKPWVCEVHFAYDEDLNLYFRSLASRRHSQEIAQNPNVAGDIIDKYGLGDSVVGLYFEGTAEKLGPGVEQQKAFECINARLKAGDGILEEAQNPEGHQFYKISVENFYVFGRFGQPHGQKHQLAWGK